MTHDVIQQLEAYGAYADAVAPAISTDDLDLRSAEPVPTRTLQRRAFPNWVVAVGAAAAVFILIGGVLWLVGGSGSTVIDEPASTTLVPPATTIPVTETAPTTLVPPATTIPVTETANRVAWDWSPLLSTTVARETPAAATCPEGTNPDAPGPIDQIRPGNASLGYAAFDQSAGRVVYVDGGATWTFDVCTNTWHQMPPTGLAPGELSGGLVYDVDSDVTVALGFESVYVYDANTNTWTRPASDGLRFDEDNSITPYGGAYDPVTGLIITSNRKGTPSENPLYWDFHWEFWAYDVDTNEWTLLGPLRLEPSSRDQLDFLGYSEQLDRLIVAGWLDGDMGTVLVDPRTGDVTVLPIYSPVVDFVWPSETYGAAGGTVYTTTRIQATTNEICGFDANYKSWTACFDVPNSPDTGDFPFPALVGDSINSRLLVINGRANVGAIDLATGEWTQLLSPTNTQITEDGP